MTPESKSLQHFLQSNLSHKFTHIKRDKFSDTSKIFLSSIFENIRQADEDYDIVDLVSSPPFKNEVPVYVLMLPVLAQLYLKHGELQLEIVKKPQTLCLRIFLRHLIILVEVQIKQEDF